MNLLALRGRSQRSRSEVLLAECRESIAPIRREAAELQLLGDRELRGRADDLRDRLCSRAAALNADARISALALVCEGMRRGLGITLYDEQLLAGQLLAAGCVAEMHTGEGKTYATAIPAGLFALTGRGVHVVTTNTYLAERDCGLLRPAFECLGLSIALLPGRAAAPLKRRAYDCDVTYGTGYEFGFDYLRDQITLDERSRLPLGAGYLQRLRGSDADRPTMQRGLRHVVIDEIDDVLLDDACSPLVISEGAAREAPDAAVHRAAHDFLPSLVGEVHFQHDAALGVVALTTEGRERIHSADALAPLELLERPWSDYVEQALHARFCLRRDVHYVVAEQQVRIVDGNTGRVFADRTWRHGLHQAIEAKEGIPITAENLPRAKVTRQRFFRLYDHLCGLTGTAAGAEGEFAELYGLPVVPVPRHRPSQRQAIPARCFASRSAAWSAATESIRSLHAAGRPVLVGTQSIADSEAFAELLVQAGMPHQVLNGRQDAAEAEVIAAAGRAGAVTIATNLAGRGTDIKLCPRALATGGLHVLALGRQDSTRVDRQLVGRCGRQGDPGSAQFFISADDALLRRHARWISSTLQRAAGSNGESPNDVSRLIDRLQSQLQRRATQERRRIALADQPSAPRPGRTSTRSKSHRLKHSQRTQLLTGTP